MKVCLGWQYVDVEWRMGGLLSCCVILVETVTVLVCVIQRHYTDTTISLLPSQRLDNIGVRNFSELQTLILLVIVVPLAVLTSAPLSHFQSFCLISVLLSHFNSLSHFHFHFQSFSLSLFHSSYLLLGVCFGRAGGRHGDGAAGIDGVCGQCQSEEYGCK